MLELLMVPFFAIPTASWRCVLGKDSSSKLTVPLSTQQHNLVSVKWLDNPTKYWKIALAKDWNPCYLEVASL